MEEAEPLAEGGVFCPRLTGLRELYVYSSEYREEQWLLESLVTASTGWSQLEKLTLEWWKEGYEYDPERPWLTHMVVCGLQNDLALLGKLPSLRSLTLVNVPDIHDWLLEQLSKAPLTELTLGGDWDDDELLLYNFWEDITPEGLVRLARNCPALRWATLWDNRYPGEPKRTIDCQTELGKQELIRMFADHLSREFWSWYCRLGGAPADGL